MRLFGGADECGVSVGWMDGCVAVTQPFYLECKKIEVIS